MAAQRKKKDIAKHLGQVSAQRLYMNGMSPRSVNHSLTQSLSVATDMNRFDPPFSVSLGCARSNYVDAQQRGRTADSRPECDSRAKLKEEERVKKKGKEGKETFQWENIIVRRAGTKQRLAEPRERSGICPAAEANRHRQIYRQIDIQIDR